MSVSVIDKYEVIETLGKGSMGVVYKAEDPTIGRMVAIKTLRAIYMGDDTAGNEALKRFQQEARSAGRLRHPNIVTIFEASRTENGTPYIVMEFIEGDSLEDLIKNEAPVSPDRGAHYLAQIAAAIDYAHRENVVHRDIKPSNVIVDLKHRPWLLDFGVAKLSDTSLTPAGTVVGTPSYMSPEQIRGERPDHFTDIFAFSVVAFELCVGKRPFPGEDFTTVVNNIIHKEPLTFAELGCTLPPALEAVFGRGLSKNKEERFNTCFELVSEMARILDLTVTEQGLSGGYIPGSYQAPAVEEPVEELGDETQKVDVLAAMAAASSKQQEPEVKPAEERSASAVSPAQASAKTKKSSTPAVAIVGVAFLAGLGYFFGGDFLTENTKVDSTVIARSELGSLQVEENKTVEEEPSAGEVSKQETAGSLSSNTSDTTNEAVEEAASDVIKVLENEVVEEGTLDSTIQTQERLPSAVLEQIGPFKMPPGGLDPDAIAVLSDIELRQVIQLPDLDETTLRAAVREAGNRDERQFIEPLEAVAEHPSFKVRVEVVKALGKSSFRLGDDVLGVLDKRLNDNDFLVRGFTARIVGRIPSPRARKLLEARQEVETNKTVKKILEKQLSSS